ncbi:hypothetical protein H6G74_12600 [Nostoc spongiaeforme FACHB-130]|uniref:Uncharacterized protein n=1 Tax=Nostoc spongiaeforme FACHB-130 TaxID=1357510 RepID=A0ABR8FXT7_9NOSO|nr:hypothetical protein [Nostoc spongiaeforme]MBD2595165.1 hypothetical protein [Nostoc spongiaeforme FACHB-130]
MTNLRNNVTAADILYKSDRTHQAKTGLNHKTNLEIRDLRSPLHPNL